MFNWVKNFLRALARGGQSLRDRRSSSRIPSSLDVVLDIDGTLSGAVIRDVSLGGLSLRTDRYIEPETTGRVILNGVKFQGDNMVLSVLVSWCSPDPTEGAPESHIVVLGVSLQEPHAIDKMSEVIIETVKKNRLDLVQPT